MVAANYAKRRSDLAKSLGLGQIRKKGSAPKGYRVGQREAGGPKARGRAPKKAKAKA